MFTFKISPDDGEPYEVVATTRDIARWERTTKGASLRQLQTEMRATDLYVIAHNAAVRHGQYDGPLKEFQDTCDITVLDDEEEEPDPTLPAA